MRKRYFENAIEFSGDQNLSAKVEYALSYARPLYDRELHDKLLQEVIFDPVKKNYTTECDSKGASTNA